MSNSVFYRKERPELCQSRFDIKNDGDVIVISDDKIIFKANGVEKYSAGRELLVKVNTVVKNDRPEYEYKNEYNVTFDSETNCIFYSRKKEKEKHPITEKYAKELLDKSRVLKNQSMGKKSGGEAESFHVLYELCRLHATASDKSFLISGTIINNFDAAKKYKGTHLVAKLKGRTPFANPHASGTEKENFLIGTLREKDIDSLRTVSSQSQREVSHQKKEPSDDSGGNSGSADGGRSSNNTLNVIGTSANNPAPQSSTSTSTSSPSTSTQHGMPGTHVTTTANSLVNSTGLQFTVKVGDLPSSTFAVAEFELNEALNAPFTLALKLASPQPRIDFAEVLDQYCELMVWYNGELQRRVTGVISDFVQGDTGFHRTRYEAVVRPALWRTELRTNCRIFQAKKPQDIIEEILKEAGIQDYAFSLRQAHAAREYCVQYRESDLAFITRLAAEEGMFFFHEFADKHHRVVFADHTGAGALEKKEKSLFFSLENKGLEQGAYVRQFSYREAVKTSSVELRDYSFKNPAYNQSNKKISNDLSHQRSSYEHYDYPGRYKQAESGKAFSAYRLDALRAEAITGKGLSNCAELRPGLVFTLSEHLNDTFNASWQVVTVKHEGKQPQALEEEGGDKPTTFTNTFGVIKDGTAWRALIPVRPMVDGPQIATVTGPTTEEIYCDEHGRVKVKFPWDRYGNSDDLSSCWVRVSQGWAGGRYGMVTIPRIGHEVVVSFLEGDPDQPIITGRTYHATNLAPYVLPHNKTRTVIRTDTHQGTGFNELSFEDAATREQVFLHAQKDHDTIINNDHRQSVGHDQHLSVVQDKFERIDRHSHRTVGQDDYELIHQDHHQSIGRHFIQSITQSFKRFIGGGEVTRIEGSRQTTLTGSEEAIIGANQRTVVNGDHYLKATDIVLEAGQSFTVKGPGGFMTIDESGITLQGNLVKVNEGGSPGVGTAPVSVEPESPAAPALPDAPLRP